MKKGPFSTSSSGPLMAFYNLQASLGPETEDSEEETFLLFAQSLPSRGLGFVDGKATSLVLTVAGHDLRIDQSPGLLSSHREQGTTGAVVWEMAPLFAEWIAVQSNVLFRSGVLGAHATVLELGCGVSGIMPLVLAPKVGRYIATDQEYVFTLLKQNLAENMPSAAKTRVSGKGRQSKLAKGSTTTDSNIDVVALDWETSSIASLPPLLPRGCSGIDVLIACDCIYNEALIQPFVSTCAEICALRQKTAQDADNEPTVCVIAQQLRSDIVFTAWLSSFMKLFRVWRVPELGSGSEMTEGSGFVIHIGVLKDFPLRST
ncbi:MAG: hypothetical protein Q9163_002238 [Psora crenata]